MLNLESKGDWVTSYIKLPNGYNVSKINIDTVILNYTIKAENEEKYGFVKDPQFTDIDSDGLLELMVKFNRTMLQEIIKPANRAVLIVLVVAGDVTDDKGIPVPFAGTDFIKAYRSETK